MASGTFCDVLDPKTTTAPSIGTSKTSLHGAPDSMVIIDAGGTDWYVGSASSSAQKNASLQPMLPSGAAAVRAAKKPPKVRASARQDAPPVYAVFKNAALLTDDPFWREVFQRMADGTFKRGFRFVPSVSDENTGLPAPDFAGRLIYKSKSREFSINVPQDAAGAFDAVNEFMEKRAGITSQSDQDKIEREIIKTSEEAAVSMEHHNCWSRIRGVGAKSTLVAHFVSRITTLHGLSPEESRDLSKTLSLFLSSGKSSARAVVMRNGSIETIRGLQRDPDTGEFYFSVDSILASRLSPKGEFMDKDSDANSTAMSTTSTRRGAYTNTAEYIYALARSANREPEEEEVPPLTATTFRTALPAVHERVEKTVSTSDAESRFRSMQISTSFPTEESTPTIRQFDATMLGILQASIEAAVSGSSGGRGASYSDGDAEALSEVKIRQISDSGTVSPCGQVRLMEMIAACDDPESFAASLETLGDGMKLSLRSEHQTPVDAFVNSVVSRTRRARESLISTMTKNVSSLVKAVEGSYSTTYAETPSCMLAGTFGRRGYGMKRWQKIVESLNANSKSRQ